MTDGDIETISAIALEDPKRIRIFMSSTPTGKRGKFWQACTEKKLKWSEHYAWAGLENPEWKDGDPLEDRFANPNWSTEMEEELKTEYSDLGYTLEILAEFGDETAGVFKKEFIDRARKQYDYIKRRESMGPIILGVDWDKVGAATQMVVMGYVEDEETEEGKFKILNREEIPKSDFTFDNGVKKIIELNDIYDLDYIYIDAGSGEYQIETLRLYGKEHPKTGLADKVHRIQFGSSKQTIDPVTKEIVNKPIKAFMVDQLSILFERDRMIINDSDQEIIRQLENFRVVRISQTNNTPVFVSEDEHTIDCMSLCVLGFVEHYPHLLNTIAAFKKATLIKSIKIKEKNLFEDKDGEDQNFKAIGQKSRDEAMVQVPVGSKPLKKALSVDWAKRGTNTRSFFKRSSI